MLQIEAETQTHTLTKNSKSSIKHAVILAAGKSSRFREKGEKLPKVLMKVGGLRLMERSILTLKETGIEHFHIVLGAYRDQIRPAIQKLPRLKDVDINFVECPNYELGNGVSFGAGAAQVNEPFLLTMCDHIFSPLHIQEFTELALEKPHLPALACDPKLNEVFDMDDATKVVSNDGFINDIGKELTEFNLVDTGLFYFPAGYGEKISTKANNGAHSVSNIIQDFIDDTGVRAPALKDPMWQDVDYPGMKKEAEIRLMKYIVSPNDGWVSKNINRFFSTRLSLILANRNVHPNAVTTLVLILSIIGAFFAGSGVYTSIILGAAIFQIASILDGCDGEIARMTYQHSWFGAWYDRLIGNIRFSLFFGALGVSAFKVSGGTDLYFYASIGFAALAVFIILTSALKSWKDKKTSWNFTEKPEEKITGNNLPDKFFTFWRKLNKQDVLAFLGFFFCIIFQFQIVFWLALAGSLIMAFSMLGGRNGGGKKKINFKKASPLLFSILGIGMIIMLFSQMDLASVSISLHEVGNAAFLVFATAILWIIFDTLSIANLTQFKVPFKDILYNQITGNGYNIMIPAAGLGGEPHKIKHLTRWLDWHTASRSIVQDRLLHALSGSLFTAIISTCAVLFIPLEEKYLFPFTAVAIGFTVISSLMIWFTLSNAPSKISGVILKKLKFLQEFENEQLPFKRFLISFSFKMTSRFLYLVEIYVIFQVLGISPNIEEVVLVGAMLMMSVSIFFFMPQGLGVNEVGISGAITILGYGATIGLTFGLLRRGRNLFWGVVGVTLHLGVTLWKRWFSKSRAGWFPKPRLEKG